MRLSLLAAAVVAAPSAAAALSPSDWTAFLERSDPVFSWSSGATAAGAAAAAPTKWYDAAFTGNGALGMMVRATQSAPTTSAHGGGTVDGLRFDVGRSDVYDDRATVTPGSVPGTGLNRTNFACDSPRLPLGIFLAHFKPNGSDDATLSSIDMRLDLFNGEVRGTAALSGGGACQFALWSNAVFTTADVSAVKVSCSPGAAATLTWVPHAAVSTWAAQSFCCPACHGYVYNPAPDTATFEIARLK